MNTQIANRERLFPRLSFSNFTSSQPSTSSSASVRVEDDSGMVDVEGKVKTRLLSMWNNVKYGNNSINYPKQNSDYPHFIGMKLKTNFSKESPVWLLGRCYHRKTDSPCSDVTELGTDVAAFQSQSDVGGCFLYLHLFFLTKLARNSKGHKQEFYSTINFEIQLNVYIYIYIYTFCMQIALDHLLHVYYSKFQ